MGKITDFLAGIKILEETESKFNGKITVIKSLAFGTYLQVGGLTQSGGIIKEIWNYSLKNVASYFAKPSRDKKVSKILVLGLGGGSIIGVVNKYWPEAKITAVDIDPTIVDLGKKYLSLSDKLIKIKISDAYKFVEAEYKAKRKYDLVLVDLYRGDEFPEKFETKKYVELMRKLLTPNGAAVFNRLYYGEKRSRSVKFGNMLEKLFKKVDWVYPQANIMFVCFS